MLIPFLVGHRRVASWSLSAVGDDVGHLAQEGGGVGGVPRHDKPLAASREGADTPREGDQGLHFLVGDVAAHVGIFLEIVTAQPTCGSDSNRSSQVSRRNYLREGARWCSRDLEPSRSVFSDTTPSTRPHCSIRGPPLLPPAVRMLTWMNCESPL